MGKQTKRDSKNQTDTRQRPLRGRKWEDTEEYYLDDQDPDEICHEQPQENIGVYYNPNPSRDLYHSRYLYSNYYNFVF